MIYIFILNNFYLILSMYVGFMLYYQYSNG